MIFTTINTAHDPINNVGIIRNEFDNIIDKTVYESESPYNTIYTKFKQIIKDKQECYINISTDRAITSSSLSALNELFMYQNGKIYESNLKVIYIDSKVDLNLNNYDNKLNNSDYRTSVVSNLLTISQDQDVNRTYTKHSLPMLLSQFIFLGMEELSPYEENLLLKYDASYYTLNKLNKKLDKILDNIIEKIGTDPVAIIFDMSVFDLNIAPCTIRDSDKMIGLNLDQLNLILSKLSKLSKLTGINNNIKMIDITGHYLAISDTLPAFRVTIETITKIYSKLLNLKEYSINIFNENTRFLIYKPVDEICNEKENDIGDNYGWYILRNISLDMRNELLEYLDIDTIKIINIKEDDDDNNEEIEIMITSTTILEQNEKCYYTSTSYKDCTLFPDEKMAMCFELVNI